MIADAAYNQLNLDYVCFMPSGNPPYKDNSQIASAMDRAEMIKLAIAPYSYFSLSDDEILRPGITYTSDTLRELTEKSPDDTFFFIMGADSFQNFENWHEVSEIVKLANICVFGRGNNSDTSLIQKINTVRANFSDKGVNANIFYLSGNVPDISSKHIRLLSSFKMVPRAQITPSVADYIENHGLYLNPEYEAVKADLAGKLKPTRYEHVLNVAKTAAELAQIYGADVSKAYYTGLLHDCAKYLDNSDMLKTAEDNGIELEPIEYTALQLVHAKVGAFFANKIYKVEDEDILNAIKYHTTGRPEMSLLEKIIYIADAIEPGRDYDIPLLNRFRAEASVDIDFALYDILDATLSHVKETFRSSVSETTQKAYDYYKSIINNRR